MSTTGRIKSVFQFKKTSGPNELILSAAVAIKLERNYWNTLQRQSTTKIYHNPTKYVFVRL
jgi:hypothetical protein